MTESDRDMIEGRLRRQIREKKREVSCLQTKLSQQADVLEPVLKILRGPELGKGSSDFPKENFRSEIIDAYREWTEASYNLRNLRDQLSKIDPEFE